MAELTQWVPTLVAGGAVGLLFWNVRIFGNRLEKKMEEEIEDLLTEEKHELLCKNAMLTVNGRINVLETNIMLRFDALEKAIKSNGG